MDSYSVILIEDDINLRHSIALMLQRVGYSITATDKVNEAVELIQSGKYFLIITDINIPETRSKLLPEVSDHYPHIPVIVLTDPASRETYEEDKRINTYYLIKPIPPELLLDRVWKIMGKTKPSTQSKHELLIEQRNQEYR